VAATARNFARALPLAIFGVVVASGTLRVTPQGGALAAMSGAITSGLGYGFGTSRCAA
jgi:hypothetical protein